MPQCAYVIFGLLLFDIFVCDGMNPKFTKFTYTSGWKVDSSDHSNQAIYYNMGRVECLNACAGTAGCLVAQYDDVLRVCRVFNESMGPLLNILPSTHHDRIGFIGGFGLFILYIHTLYCCAFTSISVCLYFAMFIRVRHPIGISHVS